MYLFWDHLFNWLNLKHREKETESDFILSTGAASVAFIKDFLNFC